jgi:hypothetical protein
MLPEEFVVRSITPMWLTCLMATAACGSGVQDKSYRGQPLATIQGKAQGQLPASSSATSPRAALVWLAAPSDAETCFASATDLSFATCWFDLVLYGIADPAATSAVDVGLEAAFPASFSLPVFAAPPAAGLIGHEGQYLGIGEVAIYNDGNGNKQLDLVPFDASMPVDTALGLSEGHSFVIYREGDLSPVWKAFAKDGCPTEPPQGFSIVTHAFESSNCTLSGLDAIIEVDLSDSGDTRDAICTRNPQPHFLTSFEQPMATAPAGLANVTCTADGAAFTFNPHPERYCWDQNIVSYYLADPTSAQSWDLRANPPAWWPCQYTPSSPPPSGHGFGSVTLPDGTTLDLVYGVAFNDTKNNLQHTLQFASWTASQGCGDLLGWLPDDPSPPYVVVRVATEGLFPKVKLISWHDGSQSAGGDAHAWSSLTYSAASWTAGGTVAGSLAFDFTSGTNHFGGNAEFSVSHCGNVPSF